MANKKTIPVYPAFPGHGVLTRDDDTQFAEVVSRADTTPDGVIVQLPGKAPVNYATDEVTADQKTGRLAFTSTGTPFRIRELREDDGEWLSRYKTLLPLPALDALVEPGTTGDNVATPDITLTVADESLDAFASDDSVYVVGIVYTNSAGRYTRVDGDWVLLAGDDDTFEDDDLSVITLDPAKANQFLAMYDQNYVTVADAQRFEDSDTNGDSEYEDFDTDK